jgi:hypothetical protein
MVIRVIGYAYGYYGYLSIFLWLLSLLYGYCYCYIIYHYYILLIMSSLIFLSPLPDKVRLAEYVCTYLFIIVFLAADSNYMPDNFE